jgi:hypothetical protein
VRGSHAALSWARPSLHPCCLLLRLPPRLAASHEGKSHVVAIQTRPDVPTARAHYLATASEEEAKSWVEALNQSRYGAMRLEIEGRRQINEALKAEVEDLRERVLGLGERSSACLRVGYHVRSLPPLVCVVVSMASV